MGPGTIRLGGIFIFVNIAVTIVGTLVAGALSSEAAKAGQAPQFGVVNVAVMIVQMLLTFFALLATKGLFNANQYRGGDIPILALVVVGAALLLIVLVAGVNPQGLVAGRGGQTAGILGIVLLVLLLIYFVLALIFAITCIKFGGRGGGGLWKATGILYLIAMLIFVVAILIVIAAVVSAQGGGSGADAATTVIGGGVLFFIGLIVGAAGLICHGIGLILGAGKLQAR